MGYIDMKIDIARGRSWIPRNLRMQSLKNNSTKKPENGESTSSSSALPVVRMNLELFLASKNTDTDGLLDTLERLSTEKNLPVEEILDQVTPTGNTLLHLCVIHDNLEGAVFIAYHFPSLIAKPNFRGDTALHLAARAGNEKIIKTLADVAPDLYVPLLRLRNEEGNTPLHEALIHGRNSQISISLFEANRTALQYVNDKGESPLYLAVKSGQSYLLDRILSRSNADEIVQGKSPVHPAVLQRQLGFLEKLLDHDPRFILSRDEEGMTPLHLATSLGYVEEVKYLLSINSDCVFEMENNGLLPIHLASIKGHINLVDLMLQYWPDPCELLTSNGQSILHVAVMSGSYRMVNYILGTMKFKELINMRDKDGNTPLHLAAMSWYPRIVDTLIWDKRVDVKSMNIEGKTALDCAENCMEKTPSYRMRLTWAALISAGVPRTSSNSTLGNKDLQRSKELDKPSMESYKDRVNTLLLVATLVATVTFAAGFTMPGGYNNSVPDQGMATMLENKWFHLFVFCDTIAMYSSIIVAVALIWAQLGDLNLVLIAFTLALPLLGVALSMMSLSFVAGVYLVVSKLRWLAIIVLVTGFILLTILTTLFFFLCFPISSNNRIIRYITHYPFRLLMIASKSYN